MRTSLYVIFILFFSQFADAQPFRNEPATNDSLLNILVKRHIALNSLKQSVPGYRIQIYFGNQRSKALEIKTDFSKTYPEVNSYVVYQQPYFKVRVGDFKYRLEALKLLKQIQPFFETAFIVKDEIKLPLIE